MGVVIVLLVLTCGGIFLVGSRRSWGRKQCTACRFAVPAQARKCPHCHEWFPRVALGLLLLGAQAVRAQEVTLVPCPAINFFGPACEDVDEGAMAPAPRPVPAPPLFDKDRMARDTPALLLTFLNQRTDANAERYLDWLAQQHAATEEAQAILTRVLQHRKASHAPR